MKRTGRDYEEKYTPQMFKSGVGSTMREGGFQTERGGTGGILKWFQKG